MRLRVLGCHGGETPRHRTSAFLVDERLTLDAGALTGTLELPAQYALEAALVSHAHLDHVRDLATLADNRTQKGLPPLVVAGIRPTLDVLAKHFFNDKLWPDFSKIPSVKAPAIVYKPLAPERWADVAGYRVKPVLVHHTIDTCAFVVEKKGVAIAYSGDTGPTDRFWEVLDATPELRLVLAEVSFPNDEQRVATLSGHHTPKTLAADLAKLTRRDVPVGLYHIKPAFQRTVEREVAKLRDLDLDVLALDDEIRLRR